MVNGERILNTGWRLSRRQRRSCSSRGGLVCLLSLLSACSVYDERIYRTSTSTSSIAETDGGTPTNVAGRSGSSGGTSPRPGGAAAAAAAGERAAGPDKTPTGTATSCALGRCWWSHSDAACSSVGAPTLADRPTSADTSENEAELYLGLAELHFGVTQDEALPQPDSEARTAWQDLGLDLDGVCTQPEGCAEQRDVSCKPVGQNPPQDRAQCRDNSLGTILTLAQRLTDVGPRFGLIENAINCGLRRGNYNLIVRIRNYNRTPDDPHVRVDWYTSGGLEMPPDWSCSSDDLSDKYKSYPLWRAGYKWSLNPAELSASSAQGADGQGEATPSSHVYDDQAYVRGGYLVSQLPDGALIRLAGDGKPFRGLSLPTHKALWIGRLSKERDNTWALHDGLAAGRATTKDIMQTFRYSGFCTGAGLDTLYQSISNYVTDNADVLASGENNPATTCDSLSFGFGFEAAQVTPGGPKPLPAQLECCPPGKSSDECMQLCGDGKLSAGESCDTAIAQGAPGACPKQCASPDPCRPRELVGEGCDARCVERTITVAKNADGCCLPGTATNADSDCTAVCGNNIIEQGESCDPQSSCGKCETSDPCLHSSLTGAAASCNVECSWTATASCSAGDKCCPPGCNPGNDSDCPTQCGDGKVDTNAGETCEANSDKPCQTSCDDQNACTQDLMTGSAGNCNVRCTHIPITKRAPGDGCCPSGATKDMDADCNPQCGNKVLEAGETCDDGNTTSGDGCDKTCQREMVSAACQAAVPDGNAECGRCVCTRCADLALTCYTGNDAKTNKECADVVACARKNRCQGAACYCGGDLLGCSLGNPTGPCRKEVEAAAHTNSATTVATRANDKSYPIGRAGALGECSWNSCARECGL